MAKISGGCLCGAVRYEGECEPQLMGDCYCVDCRKSSGTAHCSHMGVPLEAMTLSGEVSSFDKPADSGNIVSRSFCPNCGSAVFSTNSGMVGFLFNTRVQSRRSGNLFATAECLHVKFAHMGTDRSKRACI
ncbi:MAG: GFA family protein [Alphaproteobacteria bacterium]|jgi:hypothetical protein